MGSSVYSVRLSERDTEKLESLAERLAMSPADVMKLGLHRVHAMQDQPAAPQMPRPEEKPHFAKSGKRNAWICPSCLTRVFLDPGLKWDCPDHPGRAMRQANRPYRGQSTS